MKEKTVLFKILINLDRLFNILTGGDLGVCFSTRAYINSVKSGGYWEDVRAVIDYCFWDNHCKESYLWEYYVKARWLKDNKID